MKRFLSLMMTLVFVITVALGCAGLGNIKADDPKSIQVLLKKVDKIQPDEDGWSVLSIPQTKEKLARLEEEGLLRIVFVVYKKGEAVGYGMVAEDGASVVMQWNPKNQTWLFIFSGMAQQVTEEQQAEFWSEWVKILLKEFDIPAAYHGIPVFSDKGQRT